MKHMTAMIAVILLLLSSEAAFGASNKCKVKRADGKTLELECLRETADFPVGSRVKIKTDRDGTVEQSR